jgi:hypothetical protein
MNPDYHNPFEVICSDGALSSSEGGTITTRSVLRDREVEPIASVLQQHRRLLKLSAELDSALWLLDDPAMFQ